jgi:CMP-N-acetylneuraminic acid synthetase
MLAWVIEACKNCRYVGSIYVSTEDAEIASVALTFGAQVINRPPHLAADHVEKQEVVIHAVEYLETKGIIPKTVLMAQPNSPQLTGLMLEEAFEKFERFKLRELFSVDMNLIQNAAFRILRREAVFQRLLSTHCGVIVANCIDIHTLDDVRQVEKRILERR